jgi:hypothetical protein
MYAKRFGSGCTYARFPTHEARRCRPDVPGMYGRAQLSLRVTYRIARRALRAHRELWTYPDQLRVIRAALADHGAGRWPLPLGYPGAAIDAAMAVKQRVPPHVLPVGTPLEEVFRRCS